MSHDQYGLGRLPAPDARDEEYPIKAPPPAKLPAYRYHYSQGLWYDQNGYGVCVGAAWSHWIEDGPVTQSGTVDPIEIYKGLVKLDPWPQNDNGDLYFGSNVRAGAKYLQNLGWISEYRWAFDAETVARTILGIAPVVMGTDWYDSMFKPDSRGMVTLEGSVVGGHAWLLNGYNAKTRIFRAKNSWGRDWGKKGYFYISHDDLDRLINDGGEACLATEVRK